MTSVYDDPKTREAIRREHRRETWQALRPILFGLAVAALMIWAASRSPMFAAGVELGELAAQSDVWQCHDPDGCWVLQQTAKGSRKLKFKRGDVVHEGGGFFPDPAQGWVREKP
jgi:hypothetical protein